MKSSASRKRSARKAKAPKLYKRYDPVTGELAKVTKDDPRYDEWRTTRGTVASRKKALARKDPLEYARTFGVETAKKRAARAAESTVIRTGRNVARALGPGVVGTAAAYSAAITAQLAILAAGYVVMDRVAKNQQLKLGDRLNAISNEFVAQQNAIIVKAHARSWQEVPEEIRKKAVANYQRALATAAAQAQGSAIIGRVEGSYK